MSIVVLADDRPVARKAHECSDCWRTIEPGEQYRRQRNVGDDGPYVWKVCAHCDVAFHWIVATDPYADDDFGINVRDYLDNADDVDALRDACLSGWRGLTIDDVRALLPVLADQGEKQ